MIAKYLYKPVLSIYKRFFSIKNTNSLNQHAYFTFEDESYVKLILDILRALEPRFEQKNQVLVDYFDEVNEVLLFKHGTYKIGF